MPTRYWRSSQGTAFSGAEPHTATNVTVAGASTASDSLLRVIFAIRAVATVIQSTDQQYPVFYAPDWFAYGVWFDASGAGVSPPSVASFADPRFVLTDTVFPKAEIQPQPSTFTPYYAVWFPQPAGALQSEARRKGDGSHVPRIALNYQLYDPGLVIDDPLHITDWTVHFGFNFWCRSLWQTP